MNKIRIHVFLPAVLEVSFLSADTTRISARISGQWCSSATLREARHHRGSWPFRVLIILHVSIIWVVQVTDRLPWLCRKRENNTTRGATAFVSFEKLTARGTTAFGSFEKLTAPSVIELSTRLTRTTKITDRIGAPQYISQALFARTNHS